MEDTRADQQPKEESPAAEVCEKAGPDSGRSSGDSPKKKKKLMVVTQDFSKIRVEPKFSGDDVKRVEYEETGDDSDVAPDSDDDTVDIADNDDKDLAGAQITSDCEVTSSAITEVVNMSPDEDLSHAVSHDFQATHRRSHDTSSKPGGLKINKRSVKQNKKKVVLKEESKSIVHESSNSSEDMDTAEVVTPSGKFVVNSESNKYNSRKSQKKSNSFAGTVYSVKETPDVACVEIETVAGSSTDDQPTVGSELPRTSPPKAKGSDSTPKEGHTQKTKGKKRRHDDEDADGAEPKLTSKQVGYTDPEAEVGSAAKANKNWRTFLCNSKCEEQKLPMMMRSLKYSPKFGTIYGCRSAN